MVSVGIARNKMVAKLASQASKPDGILNVDTDAALQKLLKATAVSRLPRCGGKVADTLTLAGVHTVADLQVHWQRARSPCRSSSLCLVTVPCLALLLLLLCQKKGLL